MTIEHRDRYEVVVFYEDTDAAGIVYHANYIKYMERARTVFLRQRGLTLKELSEKHHIQFLIRAVNVKFERPAVLEQTLTVVTKITKLGRASIQFSQSIYADPDNPDTLVCTGDVVVVCADNVQYKPYAIPEAVLGELKA